MPDDQAPRLCATADLAIMQKLNVRATYGYYKPLTEAVRQSDPAALEEVQALLLQDKLFAQAELEPLQEKYKISPQTLAYLKTIHDTLTAQYVNAYNLSNAVNDLPQIQEANIQFFMQKILENKRTIDSCIQALSSS